MQVPRPVHLLVEYSSTQNLSIVFSPVAIVSRRLIPNRPLGSVWMARDLGEVLGKKRANFVLWLMSNLNRYACAMFNERHGALMEYRRSLQQGEWCSGPL